MAGRQLAPLGLSDEERSELESLASRRKTAQALALRARIVLACAEGAQNKDVAARLSLDSALQLEIQCRIDGRFGAGQHDWQTARMAAPLRLDTYMRIALKAIQSAKPSEPLKRPQ